MLASPPALPPVGVNLTVNDYNVSPEKMHVNRRGFSESKMSYLIGALFSSVTGCPANDAPCLLSSLQRGECFFSGPKKVNQQTEPKSKQLNIPSYNQLDPNSPVSAAFLFGHRDTEFISKLS